MIFVSILFGCPVILPLYPSSRSLLHISTSCMIPHLLWSGLEPAPSRCSAEMLTTRPPSPWHSALVSSSYWCFHSVPTRFVSSWFFTSLAYVISFTFRFYTFCFSSANQTSAQLQTRVVGQSEFCISWRHSFGSSRMFLHIRGAYLYALCFLIHGARIIHWLFALPTADVRKVTSGTCHATSLVLVFNSQNHFAQSSLRRKARKKWKKGDIKTLFEPGSVSQSVLLHNLLTGFIHSFLFSHLDSLLIFIFTLFGRSGRLPLVSFGILVLALFGCADNAYTSFILPILIFTLFGCSDISTLLRAQPRLLFFEFLEFNLLFHIFSIRLSFILARSISLWKVAVQFSCIPRVRSLHNVVKVAKFQGPQKVILTSIRRFFMNCRAFSLC